MRVEWTLIFMLLKMPNLVVELSRFPCYFHIYSAYTNRALFLRGDTKFILIILKLYKGKLWGGMKSGICSCSHYVERQMLLCLLAVWFRSRIILNYTSFCSSILHCGLQYWGYTVSDSRFPFSRLLRLARLRWRYRHPLNTGLTLIWSERPLV
jgi:hypothetical protein